MKRLLILTILALVSFSSTGCTLTETPKQHFRRKNQITKLNMRMLVEDWDYFWLYDRSSMATSSHVWIGL